MSTHNIPFLNKKKRKSSFIIPNLSYMNYGTGSKGPKNEFEPAVVNEPSVFEPLKFYCILHIVMTWHCSFSFPILTSVVHGLMSLFSNPQIRHN